MATGGGVGLVIIGSSARVAETLHSLDRSLHEHPKNEKAPTEADIASTNADYGNGCAFLMRSPRPDLSTGNMPTEGPECGSQNKSQEKRSRNIIIVRRESDINSSNYYADPHGEADPR